MEAVKAFLKPIITEAIHEASAVADPTSATAAVAMPAVPEPTQEADEAARQREALSKYYTIDEVKAILRIGTTSVYNLFKRKKLTKYKVLGKTVVLKEELDNAVECQEVCRYKHGR